MAAVDETKEEKLVRLRGEQDASEQAEKDRQADAEIEGLELEARFRAELGKKGVDFAIVDATTYGDGFIVVKLGSDLAFRKYVDAVHTASPGAPDSADVFAFVAPAVVHPAPAEFAAMVRKRGRLSGRTADALASLHGVASKVAEGKF